LLLVSESLQFLLYLIDNTNTILYYTIEQLFNRS